METSQETYIPMTRKNKNVFFRKAIIFFLFLLVLLTSATTVYFYKRTVVLEADSPKDIQPTRNETAELISAVSKLILLPEGELPTIATVSNPEELQSQPFFARAKVGDKVLLYPIAKKAYLYDPIANKIIEVSSITPENQTSTGQK